VYSFGDLHLPAGVPPGPIHHQPDSLVFSGTHLFGELPQSRREQLHVNRRQDQLENLPAAGPDEGSE
jgi:hypothetical protein